MGGGGGREPRNCLHILHLNSCNSFSRYRAIAWLTPKDERGKKEERSQKIDDLPVLATCHFGTLAML